MGITKTKLHTEDQNELAKLAKAFAHPARIAIIQYLLKSNACINNDLVQEIGLAQATISQHLRELRDIGLIKGTIEGAKMSYCIEPLKWMGAKVLFNSMFDQFEAPSSSEECC